MTSAVRALTRGVGQTRALASALGELVRPGDLIVLVGGLGAGKTAFAQGVGAGLGITDTITSPTFALVQSYSGRLEMHHLDVYRLDQVNEALDLGLAELLDDDAVVLIEWGDNIAPVLPHDYLEVRLDYGDGDDTRTIEFEATGPRWAARMRAIDTVVANSDVRAPGSAGGSS
jgi:tRNA threonylcarbamoyladenosine biosynthesis protein TsaE